MPEGRDGPLADEDEDEDEGEGEDEDEGGFTFKQFVREIRQRMREHTGQELHLFDPPPPPSSYAAAAERAARGGGHGGSPVRGHGVMWGGWRPPPPPPPSPDALTPTPVAVQRYLSAPAAAPTAARAAAPAAETPRGAPLETGAGAVQARAGATSVHAKVLRAVPSVCSVISLAGDGEGRPGEGSPLEGSMSLPPRTPRERAVPGELQLELAAGAGADLRAMGCPSTCPSPARVVRGQTAPERFGAPAASGPEAALPRSAALRRRTGSEPDLHGLDTYM